MRIHVMQTTTLWNDDEFFKIVTSNFLFEHSRDLKNKIYISWNGCLFIALFLIIFFFLLCFPAFSPAVDVRIIQEDKSEKERIQRVNQEVFGDGPQPKLEFAQYKVVKSINFVLFFCNFNIVIAMLNCK